MQKKCDEKSSVDNKTEKNTITRNVDDLVPSKDKSPDDMEIYD
jgi:hypothetical protein